MEKWSTPEIKPIETPEALLPVKQWLEADRDGRAADVDALLNPSPAILKLMEKLNVQEEDVMDEDDAHEQAVEFVSETVTSKQEMQLILDSFRMGDYAPALAYLDSQLAIMDGTIEMIRNIGEPITPSYLAQREHTLQLRDLLAAHISTKH